MLRILLCCAAGMSTSLLVTKMEAYAASQGIEAKIWAVSESTVAEQAGQFDVLLVGPQIRFRLKALQKEYGDKVPVEMIPMAQYGRMDGEAVVKQALRMVEEFGK